ncbi:hypothetical protein V7S43_011829 [Phytophthora oleae]|uniref:Uncharacterized protein n=1 Tax=Phytophthora oleae TaxID=2107226 RepID=A0ABD3FEL0_9STRA
MVERARSLQQQHQSSSSTSAPDSNDPSHLRLQRRNDIQSRPSCQCPLTQPVSDCCHPPIRQQRLQSPRRPDGTSTGHRFYTIDQLRPNHGALPMVTSSPRDELQPRRFEGFHCSDTPAFIEVYHQIVELQLKARLAFDRRQLERDQYERQQQQRALQYQQQTMSFLAALLKSTQRHFLANSAQLVLNVLRYVYQNAQDFYVGCHLFHFRIGHVLDMASTKVERVTLARQQAIDAEVVASHQVLDARREVLRLEYRSPDTNSEIRAAARALAVAREALADARQITEDADHNCEAAFAQECDLRLLDHRQRYENLDAEVELDEMLFEGSQRDTNVPSPGESDCSPNPSGDDEGSEYEKDVEPS